MIVIVQGKPAAGKTILATQLSKELGLPHISRDNIAEWIFDSAGDQAEKMGNAVSNLGYDLMFGIAGELSKGSGSFIVEGCFNPEFGGKRMLKTLGDTKHVIVEVFLTADDKILVDRYKNRTTSPDRHKAHNDEEKVTRIADHLRDVQYKPMGIGGTLIEVDTSQNPEATFEIVMSQILKIMDS